MIHVNQSNESAAFQGFLCLLSPPDFDIMAGRHQNRSYPLPGVHSSGQVHAFGNCTDSDILEEDAEVYELRSRGKEKIRRSTSRDRLDDIIVLTKDIQEGDTLNAIALQYCCTILTLWQGGIRIVVILFQEFIQVVKYMHLEIVQTVIYWRRMLKCMSFDPEEKKKSEEVHQEIDLMT
uniref:LysM domain containing 3 n=1 Tax=Sus scrofa TaxID=9823 RepID=A0A8D0NQ32_PIG